MINIALFDEDPSWFRELRTELDTRSPYIQVNMWTNYEHLIREISTNRVYPDAIFLSLKHIHKDLTIQRAERLSRIPGNIPILYVAEDPDLWDDTILFGNTNLIGYMTLPLKRIVLDRYIEKISNLKEKAKLLSVKTNGKEISIRIDSIIYLESRKHIAHIVTDAGEITTYAKLSELLPKLPAHFIQPHKSYLVNVNRIGIAELNNLILDNGISIPISRSRKNEIREKLLKKSIAMEQSDT